MERKDIKKILKEKKIIKQEEIESEELGFEKTDELLESIKRKDKKISRL